MFIFLNVSYIFNKDVLENFIFIFYIGKLNCVKYCKFKKCGK